MLLRFFVVWLKCKVLRKASFIPNFFRCFCNKVLREATHIRQLLPDCFSHGDVGFIPSGAPLLRYSRKSGSTAGAGAVIVLWPLLV